MTRLEFNKLIQTITNKRDIELLILEDQNAKKWYDKTYNDRFEIIKENTTYCIYDGYVLFDFKVGKLDSLLKTFVTQYISKYLIKTPLVLDGIISERTKETCLKELQHNSSRLSYGLCYSTNYGIGLWQILIPQSTLISMKQNINSLLESKGIKYKNETSEAGWVFRYLIDGSYLDHNVLIEYLKNKND